MTRNLSIIQANGLGLSHELTRQVTCCLAEEISTNEALTASDAHFRTG